LNASPSKYVMTKKTLKQLYAEHEGKVSDKWSSYLIEYDRIFSEYRDNPVDLLEIGIQNGGSLEIWSKFFDNAKTLVGCDINQDCASLVYDDPRIAVVVGDANLDTVKASVLSHSEKFDVIIDDGSHSTSDIVKSFSQYFPCLSDGGVFVVEDLHCGYWTEFEGGLFDPYSSITFFKRLADIVNHEHWGVQKLRSDVLRGFFSEFNFQIDDEDLAHVHSIEFVNSICVVRKREPLNNSLGSRFFAGTDESIVPGRQAWQSTVSATPDQSANSWASRSDPPDEMLLNLEKTVQNLREQEKIYAEKAAELTNARDQMANSFSWRITKPLRCFGKLIDRLVK
jgi:cephalosporin hydroxylase